MSAPVEFRYFHRFFTIQDAKAGIPPLNDGKELYCPCVLQYRYKMRTSVGGQVEMVWSDWLTVPTVKEANTIVPAAPAANGPQLD